MSKWGDGFDDDYYGSYYAPTYTPKKSVGGWKSLYSGGWSKSWSSFSFLTELDDDDEDLFVKDPISYITPTAKEIKKKVTATKQSSIDTIKELARICYLKMVEDRDYIAERYVGDYTQKSRYRKTVKKYLDNVAFREKLEHNHQLGKEAELLGNQFGLWPLSTNP
jgi:hypothetical protein